MRLSKKSTSIPQEKAKKSSSVSTPNLKYIL